ncbi:hypothetical protein [Helicobacter sp. 13S00401-1]|uniref:hypothetical protein n=1 Tax=Helicobacter sp. 13S00401-1 TaxID=1905758 RepID=UPI00209BD8CF|nr:hypothetical protein [Helicobacter sp. 13S00401-1]
MDNASTIKDRLNSLRQEIKASNKSSSETLDYVKVSADWLNKICRINGYFTKGELAERRFRASYRIIYSLYLIFVVPVTLALIYELITGKNSLAYILTSLIAWGVLIIWGILIFISKKFKLPIMLAIMSLLVVIIQLTGLEGSSYLNWFRLLIVLIFLIPTIQAFHSIKYLPSRMKKRLS